MVPSSCALDNKSRQGNSCYDLSSLQAIAKAYNKYYPKTPIHYKNMSFKELHQTIKELNQHKCQDDESCWVEQDFATYLNTDEPIKRFKPRRPPGKEDWLSTTDIHDVMEQFERKYPFFTFMGPVPINFSKLSDQLVDEVKNIDLAKLIRQGKTCVGIVFNLSPWYPGQVNSGSHWVALWIDMKKKEIGYFDSFGYNPRLKQQVHCIPFEIKRLVDHIASKNPGYTVKCNTKKRQFDNSECGMFAIHFLYQAIMGVPLEENYNSNKYDRAMNDLRDYFFRPPAKPAGNSSKSPRGATHLQEAAGRTRI
jgi:hypothetical protein